MQKSDFDIIATEELKDPETWRDRAMCKGVDINVFFAPGHIRLGRAETIVDKYRDARRYCERCPVKDECLAEAMDLEQDDGVMLTYGFWGNKTPRERVAMRRQNEYNKRDLDGI